jgi:hypothetical protein
MAYQRRPPMNFATTLNPNTAGSTPSAWTKVGARQASFTRGLVDVNRYFPVWHARRRVSWPSPIANNGIPVYERFYPTVQPDPRLAGEPVRGEGTNYDARSKRAGLRGRLHTLAAPSRLIVSTPPGVWGHRFFWDRPRVSGWERALRYGAARSPRRWGPCA